MAEQYIPNYIRRTISYNPRDILSAQEYNAILNLIITQGDYNSSWLEYLQNDAIPDAIRDISVEQIEEALTVAVREELEALSASVQNKTSRQLNNPMVTILNIGQGIDGISALDTLLTAKALNATYAIATNLVGNNAAYPTLAQLITLNTLGNDIIAYSTDGATVTTGTVDTVTTAASNYMTENNFDANVFVYPNGNTDTDVCDAVHNKFNYAVNILETGNIIPNGYTRHAPASILGNLSVVKCNSSTTLAALKLHIDDIVQHNKYMILLVDTDSESYDSVLLDNLLDYMLTKSGIIYPESIVTAMNFVHDTIGNMLLEPSGIYVTVQNGEKYINW